MVAALILCVLEVYVVRIHPLHDPVVFCATSLTYTLDAAPYFFLGAAWRIVAPKRAYHLQSALIAVLLLALLPEGMVPYEIGALLVLPYAILSFALAKPALFGWMGRAGDLSYGVYIYGFPMQQIVSSSFHTEGKPYLNFGLAILPTLVLAAASWHLLEKRFLLLKPRRRPSTEFTQPDAASGGALA